MAWGLTKEQGAQATGLGNCSTPSRPGLRASFPAALDPRCLHPPPLDFCLHLWLGSRSSLPCVSPTQMGLTASTLATEAFTKGPLGNSELQRHALHPSGADPF